MGTEKLVLDAFSVEYTVTLKNEMRHTISLGFDIFGNIQRLDNLLSTLGTKLHGCEDMLENERVQLETAKAEVDKPFVYEEKLITKSHDLRNGMLCLISTKATMRSWMDIRKIGSFLLEKRR